MDPGILLGMFVHWPALGLLPALLFGLGWYRLRRGWILAASLAWLWLVEGTRPDRWDITGAVICLIGAGIILFAPHRAPG